MDKEPDLFGLYENLDVPKENCDKYLDKLLEASLQSIKDIDNLHAQEQPQPTLMEMSFSALGRKIVEANLPTEVQDEIQNYVKEYINKKISEHKKSE